MAEPPEFWTFVLSNLIILGFGSVLTMLSYLAYRDQSAVVAFRNAALGFGLITLGGAVEPIYQLGVKFDYHLAGRELLLLQSTEGALIALGLGLLFYSIKGYRRPSRALASISRTGTDNSR